MRAVTGRKEEIKTLQSTLQSNHAELVAIYGRRRVGKTYLVKQVYKNHVKFEISGIHKGPLKDQLENFTNIVKSKTKRFNKQDPPTSWIGAFNLLSQYLNGLKSKNKKVIFIDEFPWLATPKSRFLMAFENFWNSYAANRKDLVVVICGSSASYMIQKIIRNKGGLHNRITKKIRLLPFTLLETQQFLKSKRIFYDRYQILQLYMVMGGIPHYLTQLEKGRSVMQNIDCLCFKKDGLLVDEFMNVFASLFTNSERHELIVRTLASVGKGMTRDAILAKTGFSSSGDFTKTINELIESGFVSQYFPYGKKVKLSLFRLSDEYSIFYLKFMDNTKGMSGGSWLQKMNSRSYNSWSGFSFETLCLKHVEQIKHALGLQIISSRNASWHNENAQIDLVIDRDDNVINLCEIKFTNKEFTITKKYVENLRNKISEFQLENESHKTLFFTMITTFGVTDNIHSQNMVDNSITADSLFEF